MNKIKIIVPWFGHWPPWIEYYLLSCLHNRDVTWLLVTDSKTPTELPQNVEYIQMNLHDFNIFARKKLNLQINIRHPYKICDLRPSFGLLFEDFLKNVDFWGYSDLDLIYGDIRSFLTDELLETADIISPRKEYLAGHFAIFRNRPDINRLFRFSPQYKRVFEDSKRHYAFDERSNIFGRNLYGLHPRFEKFIHMAKFFITKNKLEHPIDMNEITQNLSEQNRIRFYREDMVRSDLWFRKQNQAHWEVQWSKGRLSDMLNQKELLHFHIIESKRNVHFTVNRMICGRSFSIGPSGIFPLNP